jgi:hypothetical protein
LNLLLTTVETAGSPAAGTDDGWMIHVLRASDGSHYVAVSFTPPPGRLTDRPILIYLRLATAPRGKRALAERSAVREWLQGSRTDPRLLPRRGGIAIGEMPAMGAGASIVRGGVSAVGSADLKIMDLERERARQRKEEEEKRRRAELEGTATSVTDRLPFEDFELGTASVFADGTRAIQRAFTAGPGTYDLTIAWVDASQPPAKAQPQHARRSLQLAPASATDLGLSSVIVADGIGVRTTPYTSIEQRAHPYALGATDITPARDAILTPDERLAVAFQIVNPMAAPSGKPDLRANLRIARLSGVREEPVASLSPLVYDATTLPPDFDVRLGHPVIAAMAAPLKTIPRGDYRLIITIEDRVAGTMVSGGTDFSVIGTPASLLAEAPPLGPRFDRAGALAPPALGAVVEALAPAEPSAALSKALLSARAGRLGELLIEERVPPEEQAVRVTLTGIGLLSVGDLGAVAQFERASQLKAPGGPIQYLIGAARASQNRDADAVTAWRAARDAGFAPSLVETLIADAYLRQGDYRRAAEIMSERPTEPAALRTFAATRIAMGRPADAVAVLDSLLSDAWPEGPASRAADAEVRWLLLHALYAEFVAGNRSRGPRVAEEAARYIESTGPHAALAQEWRRVVTSS